VDFAIIETGGKQYKITPNSTLSVEKLEGLKGSKVTFDKVLMLVDGDDIKIGNPYLKDVSFEAEIDEQYRGEKIRILRFRAKSRHRRRQGHRQSLTKVTLKKTITKKPVSAKKDGTPAKK
jgi:large subunit ribosomal protein L21